jgi:hypothetical protein
VCPGFREHSGGSGSLEQQAEESLADAYAVFLALDSLIGGPQGPQVLEMLDHGATPRPEADTTLISAVLLSAFSLFSGNRMRRSTHRVSIPAAIHQLSHGLTESFRPLESGVNDTADLSIYGSHTVASKRS